jgi:hydrogenase nickel incorporation protein HypA/HybF
MHELSLIREMLDIALATAETQRARAIHRIHVRVGGMSGVVPEALSFAFPIAARGTLAERAVLDIEMIPVVAFCSNCESNFAPSDVVYLCPQCGEPSGEICSGNELSLHAMEITTHD